MPSCSVLLYGELILEPSLALHITSHLQVEAARTIARSLNNPAQFNELRESIIANENQDWEKTATLWLDHII